MTEREKGRDFTELKEWCLAIPKIELHAHLNGCIRDSTLLELAEVLGERGEIVFDDVKHVINKYGRTLTECFQLFDLFHILATDHETISRITKEAVEDFAAENVVYLELRTTPKNNETKGMTKRSYLKAVINGLRSVESVNVSFINPNGRTESFYDPLQKGGLTVLEKKRIYVRLLLSIDRRETTAAAMETVSLALEMRELGVVGIDLSGNPIVGEWNSFFPALKYAKEMGLPITLHCGEIEICLTSNLRTERLSSIDLHHFGKLFKAKHPLVLCTDDTGLFSTSLSNEYYLAATTFGLDKESILQLSTNAIHYVFADNELKKTLREIFQAYDKRLVDDFSL
ncbi:hypothetical protein HPP92_015648 [Vanilla planifolia]|uniref:Adenosine deaminase domain-containing protein n=1 Tax=Vanilla planifolia TaxID=51239 RepID=A0A835QNS2_VANPL|nr:hypothetical protein HPP92_016297 [Vanilla planifolia]KAG0471102.1 hypothetical protein HPP92_015648 [Vanilla planifolia]